MLVLWSLGLQLCMPAGCNQQQATQQPGDQPQTALEAMMAEPRKDQPQNLDELIPELSGHVQELQDRQAELLARCSSDAPAAPGSDDDPGASAELCAAELRAVEQRLEELENQLVGIQRLAVRLGQTRRPDLRQCAEALAGLRREWDQKWAEITGRPVSSHLEQ
jgi:hypothetical protein